MTPRVVLGACKLEQCRRPVQGAEYCSPECYGIAYGKRRCVLCGVGIALNIWGHDVTEETQNRKSRT